jgi:hypothetical protein
MDTWIYGYMNTWIHGYMDTWIHGYMDTWIHGYMDAWIHGSLLWSHLLLHSHSPLHSHPHHHLLIIPGDRLSSVLPCLECLQYDFPTLPVSVYGGTLSSSVHSDSVSPSTSSNSPFTSIIIFTSSFHNTPSTV